MIPIDRYQDDGNGDDRSGLLGECLAPPHALTKAMKRGSERRLSKSGARRAHARLICFFSNSWRQGYAITAFLSVGRS